MVEISQRISMTSRAAARFSTMEDMLGSLGVWGGFCLRAIGERILSGIDAVSRGIVRDRSAGGVGFRAILLNLKAWKKLCYSGKRNVHPVNVWFTSSCVRRSISN